MENSGQMGTTAAPFLLAQVGAHAAAVFQEHLAPLGLTPAHTGLLRLIAMTPGQSQQELATKMGAVPSRLVALLDQLEKKRLVERRTRLDRRTYALHLTVEGIAIMPKIGAVAMEHGAKLLAALTPEEQATLASLLKRIADEQGLEPGVHPGMQRR